MSNVEVSMEHHEGKLRSLTILEKLELISIVESGRSIKDVAEEYSVNRNTLHYILKNKDTIKANAKTWPGIATSKRIKKSKCPELEKRVLEFMYASRERNEKLSGSSIKAMALELATELQVENFSASNGWLFSLFKRNQITISEFNKGIDTSVKPKKVQMDQRVTTVVTTVHEELHEDNIEAETSERYEEIKYRSDESTPKGEYEMENFEYTTSDSCNELFETEIVEEEEPEERIIEEITESDSSWRNWCRICGGCGEMQVIDADKIEICQFIFSVS